jgi:peptidoglycan hydrolase-like protein with peptidoglycan-binding domain
MKKVIKLTESDLEKIVKKVLQEQSMISEIESDESDFADGLQDVKNQIVNFNQSATTNLKQNMMTIQRKLKSLGYDLGKFGPNGDGIDGNYGRRTLAAIKDFQRRNNIKATGWVGSKTAPLLDVEIMKGVKFLGDKVAPIKKKIDTLGDKVSPIKKKIGNAIDQLKPQIKKVDPRKPVDTSKTDGKTVKKLQERGFHVNKKGPFEKNKGYRVFSCKEKGCAQFTNNMLDASLGDAWQAYTKFNAEANVSPAIVKQMADLFSRMNKQGTIPSLDDDSSFDGEAKKIVQQLVPNQSEFQNLSLGTVVGLFYPNSNNYDLAFFQSAIGKSRDNKGNFFNVTGKPYFCKNPKDCSSTVWNDKDLGKNVKFYPGNTLSSGKSFVPNTHLGFIGYIDNSGEPYIVHNVHQGVYAYPVNKLGGGNLSIIWAGDQIDSGVAWLKKNNPFV